jgi:Ca2+-binding RTX toxin-like protein
MATFNGTPNNDLLTGTEFNDTMRGYGGSDTLYGGGGGDSLYGDSGADLLFGGDGDDTFFTILISSSGNPDSQADVYDGGDGLDSISVTGGTGFLYVQSIENVEALTPATEIELRGTAGNNRIIFPANAILNLYSIDGLDGNDEIHHNDDGGLMYGGQGHDTILGQGGNDTIYGDSGGGTPGDDALYGGAGDDYIESWYGNDKLFGGDGNDTLVASAIGDGQFDTIDGGSGVDTLSSYGISEIGSLSGVERIIDPLGDGAVLWADTSDYFDLNSFLEVSGILIIGGGGGNDTLVGLAAAEELYGGLGNDSLSGGDGDDFIVGYEGADTLSGGAGFDTLSYYENSAPFTGINIVLNSSASGGDAAGDVISGFEKIIGGSSTDTIVGSSGDDFIEGADKSDSLNGGAGIDTLIYFYSSQGVTINLGTGQFIGGDAQGDVAINFENVEGTNYADTITGDANGNVLRGWAGNDTLTGSQNADTLHGDDGVDSLHGGSGNDVSYGGAQNDFMGGQAGTDGLYGGTGNDRLEGGANADTLDGGDGIDTLSYALAPSSVTLNLATNSLSGSDAAGDIIQGFEIFEGSAWNDTITAATSISQSLRGLAGTDTLTGGDGHDTIEGGAGADVLDGGSNSTSVGGGSGDTLSYASSASAVTVNLATSTYTGGDAAGDVVSNFENAEGSAHADTLTGDTNANRLIGRAGTDTLTGGDGNDALDGGAGGDSLAGGVGQDTLSYASATSSVTVTLLTGPNVIHTGDAAGDTFSDLEDIQGSAANDVLTGKGGTNYISGEGGDDILRGVGSATDYLFGGSGFDTARYPGDRNDYSWGTVNNQFQVVDINSADSIFEGTEYLAGIERLDFDIGADELITSPLILDLDGTGISWIDRAESNAFFDFDGDGIADRTSWFGTGDAILVYDRNRDGMVSNAGELSFANDAPYARSDLDGLRGLDENGDGQFNAADSAFADFLVWRDDEDGRVEDGELVSLAEADVYSIGLRGTPTTANWDWGQTAVVAWGEYETASGTRRAFADVVLMAESSLPFDYAPPENMLDVDAILPEAMVLADIPLIWAERDARIAAAYADYAQT